MKARARISARTEAIHAYPHVCGRGRARPARSHLTSGKPAQARKRLTPGAKKRIMQIDICFTVVSQAGFLSGTLASHRRRFIRARLQLYLHRTCVDTQPYPNPTGLNGKAAQSSLELSRGHYGKGGLCQGHVRQYPCPLGSICSGRMCLAPCCSNGPCLPVTGHPSYRA